MASLFQMAERTAAGVKQLLKREDVKRSNLGVRDDETAEITGPLIIVKDKRRSDLVEILLSKNNPPREILEYSLLIGDRRVALVPSSNEWPRFNRSTRLPARFVGRNLL